MARLGVAVLAVWLSACSSAAASPTAVATAIQGLGLPVSTPQTWSSTPTMAIDPAKIYLALLHTVKGDITIELYADKAPNTVNNFVFLARQGFYNKTTFHRVIADFMAQGGDPTGTGAGGPGYQFANEISPDLKFDKPGVVAMANSGADTNGSQFFITYAPAAWLDGGYSIFGQVVSGMDVALSLRERDPDGTPPPNYLGDELISVTISESSVSLLPTLTPTPTPKVPQPVGDTRPLATPEVTARMGLYTAPPQLAIDLTHTYQAVVQTTKGPITIELFAADAPQTVNNFVVLSRMGYYDNFPVNFVQTGRFVLTGSPSGIDSDIGYTLPKESVRKNEAGAVGCWIRPNQTESSGSMFYILLQNDPSLDGAYTVFGKVTKGLDVAAILTANDKIEKIEIIDLTITETSAP